MHSLGSLASHSSAILLLIAAAVIVIVSLGETAKGLGLRQWAVETDGVRDARGEGGGVTLMRKRDEGVVGVLPAKLQTSVQESSFTPAYHLDSRAGSARDDETLGSLPPQDDELVVVYLTTTVYQVPGEPPSPTGSSANDFRKVAAAVGDLVAPLVGPLQAIPDVVADAPPLATPLAALVSPLTTSIAAILQAATNPLDGVAPLVNTLTSAVGAAITPVITNIPGQAVNEVSSILQALSDVAPLLLSQLTVAVPGIVSVLQNIPSQVGGFIDSPLSQTASAASGAPLDLDSISTLGATQGTQISSGAIGTLSPSSQASPNSLFITRTSSVQAQSSLVSSISLSQSRQIPAQVTSAIETLLSALQVAGSGLSTVGSESGIPGTTSNATGTLSAPGASQAVGSTLACGCPLNKQGACPHISTTSSLCADCPTEQTTNVPTAGLPVPNRPTLPVGAIPSCQAFMVATYYGQYAFGAYGNGGRSAGTITTTETLFKTNTVLVTDNVSIYTTTITAPAISTTVTITTIVSCSSVVDIRPVPTNPSASLSSSLSLSLGGSPVPTTRVCPGGVIVQFQQDCVPVTNAGTNVAQTPSPTATNPATVPSSSSASANSSGFQATLSSSVGLASLSNPSTSLDSRTSAILSSPTSNPAASPSITSGGSSVSATSTVVSVRSSGLGLPSVSTSTSSLSRPFPTVVASSSASTSTLLPATNSLSRSLGPASNINTSPTAVALPSIPLSLPLTSELLPVVTSALGDVANAASAILGAASSLIGGGLLESIVADVTSILAQATPIVQGVVTPVANDANTIVAQAAADVQSLAAVVTSAVGNAVPAIGGSPAGSAVAPALNAISAAVAQITAALGGGIGGLGGLLPRILVPALATSTAESGSLVAIVANSVTSTAGVAGNAASVTSMPAATAVVSDITVLVGGKKTVVGGYLQDGIVHLGLGGIPGIGARGVSSSDKASRTTIPEESTTVTSPRQPRPTSLVLKTIQITSVVGSPVSSEFEDQRDVHSRDTVAIRSLPRIERFINKRAPFPDKDRLPTQTVDEPTTTITIQSTVSVTNTITRHIKYVQPSMFRPPALTTVTSSRSIIIAEVGPPPRRLRVQNRRMNIRDDLEGFCDDYPEDMACELLIDEEDEKVEIQY